MRSHRLVTVDLGDVLVRGAGATTGAEIGHACTHIEVARKREDGAMWAHVGA